MSERYGHISYNPPDEPADSYVDRAMAVLQDIEAEAPTVLPVFLAANSVLTMSGVRVYDAYHEFYDFHDEPERRSATDVLRHHGMLVLHAADAYINEAEGPAVV